MDGAIPSFKANTGISGLDAILDGGLPRNWTYLVQGEPGTGKTTLGMQFLLAGVKASEPVLYISTSHTTRELQEIARSHNWSLEGVELFELAAGDLASSLDDDQSVFRTSEIELSETMRSILAAIRGATPERMIFDSLEQMRLLAASPLRYQKEMLALKQTLGELGCTALFLDCNSLQGGDQELQAIVHGILKLEQTAPDYGSVRRRLQVTKMRGTAYHGGYHDFRIRSGGLEVYQRLEAVGGRGHVDRKMVKSGVVGLDLLVGGGLEEGSACLIVGSTGTGKSNVATLYAHTAAKEGKHVAVFLFDERLESFYQRAEGLAMDVQPFIKAGSLSVRQVSTGELSPGEFTDWARRAVDEDGARVVIIDSLTGYLNAMPQEHLLITQMHELLSYMSQRGVLTLPIMSQRGIFGGEEVEPFDIGYLADTVLLLRSFEHEGLVWRSIAAIKKRQGLHEQSPRELRFTSGGLKIGEPLTSLSGVLSSTLTFNGNRQELMERDKQ